MLKIYGIYSHRGLHTERTWGGKKLGEKRIILYGKARAEEKAQKLTKSYRRKYWVSQVEVNELEEKV